MFKVFLMFNVSIGSGWLKAHSQKWRGKHKSFNYLNQNRERKTIYRSILFNELFCVEKIEFFFHSFFSEENKAEKVSSREAAA